MKIEFNDMQGRLITDVIDNTDWGNYSPEQQEDIEIVYDLIKTELGVKNSE